MYEKVDIVTNILSFEVIRMQIMDNRSTVLSPHPRKKIHNGQVKNPK